MDHNDIVWVEAAMVQPGMRQHTIAPPVSEIADVVDVGGVDASGERVIVSYTDGSTCSWGRHEELPILVDEPNGAKR